MRPAGPVDAVRLRPLALPRGEALDRGQELRPAREDRDDAVYPLHALRAFAQEVAGVSMLGASAAATRWRSAYVEATLDTEMSGNVIDLCLSARSQQACPAPSTLLSPTLLPPPPRADPRPSALSAAGTPSPPLVEAPLHPSIDVLDGCGANIKVDTRAGGVMRVQPRTNEFINGEWISDKTRYAVDGAPPPPASSPLPPLAPPLPLPRPRCRPPSPPPPRQASSSSGSTRPSSGRTAS